MKELGQLHLRFVSLMCSRSFERFDNQRFEFFNNVHGLLGCFHMLLVLSAKTREIWPPFGGAAQRFRTSLLHTLSAPFA